MSQPSESSDLPPAEGPLAGLRVVEVGGERGQWAAKLLADMGADVIKVEPPEGDSARRAGPFAADQPELNGSLYFWANNTSKRGVTLNLSHPEGAPLLRRLIHTADVLIESLPPGTMAAYGMAYEQLAAATPTLVMLAISPFGQDGPWRDRPATDLTQLALGGPMASCGYDEADAPGAPPIRPDGDHATLIAGVYAANMALAALLERERTGLGQYLDLSIHEACAATTEGAFPRWEYARQIVRRQTGRHAQPRPTERWQHQCADGRFVNLMGGGIPRNPTSWRPLLAWMAEKGLAHDLDEPRYESTMYIPAAERRGNPDAEHVTETLHAFVRSLPAEEVYRGGQAARLPYAIIRSPEENLLDPHWEDRRFFRMLAHPERGAAFPYPGAPYRFSGTPGGPRHRAPLLGEHNLAIFRDELQLDRSELRRLMSTGVI